MNPRAVFDADLGHELMQHRRAELAFISKPGKGVLVGNLRIDV